MTRNWYRRPRVWIALGIFVLTLIVYQLTVSPSISFWDCGEYISTSHILGIPHQPGTPLYVLMGRCFDILLGSPDINQPAFKTAAAVNFMSSLFSALAVMFLYLVILNMARRADPDSGWLAHVGGIVGALFLLLSETYWNNAIEAEVYGLAAFIMTFVTWLALHWYDSRGEKRSNLLLFLIIYLLGMGIGFHLGSLLVFPGILIMGLLARERKLPAVDFLLMSLALGLFILWTQPQDRSVPILSFMNYGHLLKLFTVVFLCGLVYRSLNKKYFVLVGTGLFLLGLSVHLFMLIRAPLDPVINQSQPDNLETLISVLRREQYPPMDIFRRQANFGWQIGYYYDYFINQFYFLGNGLGLLPRIATFLGPVFLGLLGIFHGIRRARPVIWLLITNYLINADMLNLYLNFTDHEVRDRDYFFFAAFMFFAIFIGLGTAALLRYAAGPEGKTARELESGETVQPVHSGILPKIAAGMLVFIAALPILQPGHSKWFEHDRSENTIAVEYAWNILAGLDKGSLLFTNGDNDTFPIWYLQEVEHFRRDVTVVNLSLVNLPWYVKQMRRRDPPLLLDKGVSDEWLDKLQPIMYEDPETGERRLVYVRDYVVHDIVTANARSKNPRPVFFAVTIPHENMAAYYPYLQMEGLAYRLTMQKSSDGHPIVDGNKLLANMFGIYDYTGLMDGDKELRQNRFREYAGWQTDVPPYEQRALGAETTIPYQDLMPLVGQQRVDIYRDTNTVHLLGNYPAALVRAGYDFLLQAHTALSQGDSNTYDQFSAKALPAFELAARFDPLMQPVVDIYPLLLVENGRGNEALAYMTTLHGRITSQQEEKSLFELVFAMTRIGQTEQAQTWLRNQIGKDPDRKFLYDLLFKVNFNLEHFDECREVLEMWAAHNGEADPAMVQDLQALQEKILGHEQKRIQDAVQGGS